MHQIRPAKNTYTYLWRFNKLFQFKKLDFFLTISYVRLYVVQTFWRLNRWHTWLWNTISSSLVWESGLNGESVSLALFSSVSGEGLLALAVFPALQSFVFALSVCPLSLAACSGPFIVCCLLYQFLLVPSAPRVFSLRASGVFWSWPVLRWGPARVCEEWCVRCCVEASGTRLGLKPQNTKLAV